MTMRKGIQSIEFSKTPYIKGWASVAGQKEGEGPLGNAIDQIIEDPYFGQKSWELAEGRFMKQALCLRSVKQGFIQKISGMHLLEIFWNRTQRRFLV